MSRCPGIFIFTAEPFGGAVSSVVHALELSVTNWSRVGRHQSPVPTAVPELVYAEAETVEWHFPQENATFR
jgi:hypothetical protein